MHYVWDSGESADIETVSDYVTTAKLNKWNAGDIIVISAPTGSGKSYFVKHTLRDYLVENGLRCLYLLPRVRIKEQFQQELPNDATITFATYQAVDTKESIQASSYRGKYDVVVADEAHYFFADADYNHGTDLSFEWIMKQRSAIRIFMSATCDLLIESFDKYGVPYVGYVLEREKTQINSLNFFWNELQLDSLAERIISDGEKGIFFIQSAEKARDLYLKYKDKGLYLCSLHNEKFKKYIDETLIDDLLKNENFDCSLLITTLALDSGVTLKDRSITTIITDVTDPVSIIQCVGRKRFIDENDQLNVYILARTNQQINGMLRKQRERMNIVHYFLKFGPAKYNAKYGRSNDADHLIYDAPVIEGGKITFVKRVNWLKYIKVQWDIRMYRDMLRLNGNGYIPYVAKMLGCEEYSILEENQRMQNLTEYLDAIAGNPILTKADRKPLIEMLDIRHNGKLLSTYKVLAAWLESSGLPYRLHEYRTNKVIEGKRKNYRAWEVVRLTQ